MSVSPEQRFVTVARILRARGNKGEVAAELLTDFPERLPEIKEMFLRAESGARRGVVLREFWVDRNHPGKAVFHFEAIDSINEAEKLRGLEVQIPFEQRAQVPSGSFFLTDLIGCSVFELAATASPVSSSPCSLAEAPALLGKVRDVYFPGEGQPGTPLLAVDTSRGEVLVPLADDICTMIEITARRIEVRLPEGLRDLNA
ncbi:MAG TPA: ribosome maturation factor RimM [Candidatus Acidoferrum sp.]|jgi:16S rRNA processing protein RimM|nr:ribosome maturation factor RimM [Candidatus Acidoferrum sp.]